MKRDASPFTPFYPLTGVDIEWRDGELTRARLTSDRGAPCVIDLKGLDCSIQVDGDIIQPSMEEHGYAVVQAQRGQEIVIQRRPVSD